MAREALARVAFVTLGCAKNEVDSDKMRARLEAAGFAAVDDPASSDVVVVNTCSFLVSAVDESLDVVFDLFEQREQRQGRTKILVAGCMPSRYGDDLADDLVEADGFIAASDEEHIVEKVCSLLGIEVPGTGHLDLYRAAERSQAGPSAYVKISDGCDRCCTYCMIPRIRGRYHSFDPESILAEVAELVEAGTREIVFIGQDTGIWGHDLEGRPTLACLLERAATQFPDTWLRVLYLQPEGIDDVLLDTIAAHGNICSYIDMPLQHCDARVLSAMNRHGSPAEYLRLVERIRERVEGIVLRTTLMAGFPGETPGQFEELLDFVDEAGFDYAVVFPYSQEEGSPAALLDDQVPEDERIERAQALLDACEAVGVARTAAHVGSCAPVLVEGHERTDVGLEAVGRWQGQAPDVDGQVHIPIDSEEEAPVGSMAMVKFVDSFYYELEGELTDVG